MSRNKQMARTPSITAQMCSGPWHYMGWVVGLTWTCRIPAALLSRSEPGIAARQLHYVGGAMPTVVTPAERAASDNPRAGG